MLSVGMVCAGDDRQEAQMHMMESQRQRYKEKEWVRE